MTDITPFNSWPSGRLPKEWQRPELDLVRRAGYSWNDPRDVVDIFERKVAEFAGAKYGVSVDCCTHGVFLSLKYLKAHGLVEIPRHTYQSIPMYIRHAGCQPTFRDEQWSGMYQLRPYPVWDAATRWRRGMYQGGFHVVSFQIKKRVPIGRGGMILTDDADAYHWLCQARYDGRDMAVSQWDDDADICGWHMYMTPEDAARGILLMDQVPEDTPDCGSWQNYSDLSQKKLWKD
jgi:dTDP-4-amino-4,6-dideoxygalactose transaminase